MSVSPRVNSATLLKYPNQPVRVVGTVHAYDENKTQMQIVASDGGQGTHTQTHTRGAANGKARAICDTLLFVFILH